MIPPRIKARIAKILPKPLEFAYKCFRRPEDAISLTKFLFRRGLRASLNQRAWVIKKFYDIYGNVECPHTQQEVLSFIETILSIPQDTPGCIIEAGCYKGGSTTKFSIAAKIARRRLIVFDSFEGIPQHDEPGFLKGVYCGKIEEVKRNVADFGDLSVCDFVKGLFADTMPTFSKPVAAIYLDVDLAMSTRTCLKYLYPLLAAGGTLYSHDGHLPPVIRVLEDDQFWKQEVGCPKPYIEGLGKKKLIRIVKSIDSGSK
jgi:O-methyltransferase